MHSKSSIQKKNSQIISNSIEIQNYSTWLKGKRTGMASLNVELHFRPYFEQLMCGVMTERGLRRAKVSIMKGFHFKTDPILNELNETYTGIDSLYDTISKELQIDFKDEFFVANETSESWGKLRDLLTKLDDILAETNRRSSKTFIYSRKKEKFDIQLTFLKIGKLLMKGYDLYNDDCSKIYFKVLEKLLKRGELDLNSLGFEKRKSGKTRTRKLEIGLKYQRLSYEILNKVLSKIMQKGLRDHHRKFIEFYLAHSYFRIPKFRMILLKSMNNHVKGLEEFDDLYTRNESLYNNPIGPERGIIQLTPNKDQNKGNIYISQFIFD